MTKFDNSIFSSETDIDFMSRFNSIDHNDTRAIGELICDELNRWLKSDAPKTDAAKESAIELGIGATEMRDGAEASPATAFLMGAVYMRWSVQAIGLERIAGMGHISERTVRSQQKGLPVTPEAKQLFEDGVSIREVATICKVGRSIAERWRKEILKK